jgi:hypothetical protein
MQYGFPRNTAVIKVGSNLGYVSPRGLKFNRWTYRTFGDEPREACEPI